MDRLLTAQEVAERLGVNTQWVWAQARAGRIPHVRLGRYRRFRESAVEAGCASSRRTALRLRSSHELAAAPDAVCDRRLPRVVARAVSERPRTARRCRSRPG